MEPQYQLLRVLAKSGHVLSERSGTNNVAHGKIRAVPSPGKGGAELDTSKELLSSEILASPLL